MRSAIWLALTMIAVVATAGAAIRVQSVIPESPAEAAGIMPGDRLRALDGRNLDGMADLRAVLGAHQPGDTVPVVVQRGDEPVTLSLTLGKASGGGASIGVRLEVGHGGAGHGAPPGSIEPGSLTARCLDWIEETYQVETQLERFDLDMEEDYDALRTCVAGDIPRMDPNIALKACDNVFKVHCSALNLLTEIGESIVDGCRQALGDAIGSTAEGKKMWQSCAEDEIFDRYVLKGQVSDAKACRAVWRECAAGPEEAEEQAAWRGWGGPGQEFRAPASRLAEAWPEQGPEKLWSRPLGEGYSGILFESGRLYTMYRQGEQETVICLDAASGESLWERRYDQPPAARHVENYGLGPNSTPALAGDRLFTVGVAGTLNALDKRTGEILWTRELWGDGLEGTYLQHGYSSSPMARGDLLIVPVGGDRAGLVAFEQASGRIVWTSPPMANSYSSPRLMDILGQEQVVMMMAGEIISLDPATGSLLWSFAHENPWRTNVSLPLLAGGDTVFLSSPQVGARGIRITRDGSGWHAEEIWANRRVQFYHVSATRAGDWVYGSSGTASPAFMSAVNMLTGEMAWRQRGFGKANTLEADGKLVILDEDGVLYLASPHPDSLEVLDRAQLLEPVAWTVPTLVGTTLYARNREVIMAVSLG